MAKLLSADLNFLKKIEINGDEGAGSGSSLVQKEKVSSVAEQGRKGDVGAATIPAKLESPEGENTSHFSLELSSS